MYVSTVRLANVRGFHDERDVDLDLRRPDGSHAGWTVFAGRNGSGKTSLLRAIALAIGGPAVARSLLPDFSNWVSVRKQLATVVVGLSFDEGDRFALGGQQGAAELMTHLIWSAPDGEDQQPTLEDDRSSNTAHFGPWFENPRGWFCAAYGPFRRLAGGGDAQRLMVSRGPVARMASLFHEDASLAEGVGWLIEQHLRALEKRQGAEKLKKVALAVLGDGLLPNGYQIRDVDSEGLWVESGGHRFPLREMSDGYRTVAALVVDLLKQIQLAFGALPTDTVDGRTVVTASGVVIIDEVDAHLHVSWQQRIGPWLTAHFPRIQFLVTTHSPYVCQAADRGGLIRLPGPDELARPRVVDEALYERVVYGSGDDAVLSDLFGLDTPYSKQAQALRDELGKLEIAVLTGQATAEQTSRFAELQEKLTSSPASKAHDVQTRLERTRAKKR